MPPQEDAERAKQAATGMADFMRKLTESIEQHRRGQKSLDEGWGLAGLRNPPREERIRRARMSRSGLGRLKSSTSATSSSRIG